MFLVRSRLYKKNRSRISLLDRVVESRRKKSCVDAVLESSVDPVAGSTARSSKKRFFWHAILTRLRQPVGFRAIFLLFLTWVIMLVIIWGAVKEIMSLGAPSKPKQSIIQTEQKALIELLGALVMGGMGVSLVMTPALRRSSHPKEEAPIAVQLNPSKE